MRAMPRRPSLGSIAVAACTAMIAACGEAPTDAASVVPVPTASEVSLQIVDAGTPSISALLTNQGRETLALTGCVVIEEGRGDAWVPVTPDGCALAELVVAPAQAMRLGVPPGLATSAVRVRLRVQTRRDDGRRSLGSLELVAAVR